MQRRAIQLALGFLATGCAPIPHRVATLHEIDLAFHASSGSPATIRVTNDPTDSVCARPVREVEMRDGQSGILSGLLEQRKWMLLLPHDPITGFRVCIEQDGKRYLGAHYFHMGQSRDRVKVTCGITEATEPTREWAITFHPDEAPRICLVERNR